ncbi:amidohydrolase family protein [Spongiactinospora sp. 9N601]|uniref:amidohydrolase family protein n=1 Tax=Spongiactinospora sp. 9N601 TaxID=3375149 RepID=UPI0037ACC276
MNRVVIRGGAVLTLDPQLGQFAAADVVVEDGVIAAVAPGIGESVGDAEVIDAGDMIVMPGFVDTHRHTWQAPLRHIASDWSLGQYFTGIHRGFSAHYRPQDTYAGTLIGAVEALDSGITTLVDWSHNLSTPEHADAAVQALRDSGMRAIFTHGGGPAMYQQVPSPVPHDRDVVRVRAEHFSSEDQLVTMMFGPRVFQYSTPEIALQDWKLGRELGLRFSIHVGDGEWGKHGPVAKMRDHGLLADDITYLHCNTLSDDELKMMADSGGTASVAADGEATQGHGWPATGRLIRAGIRPSLSIDVCPATGGSMFHAMKATISIERALDNATRSNAVEQRGLALTCQDVLEFATIEGARACGLEARTGSLTPGKDADLIMIRTDDLAMTPLNHPAGAVVNSAHTALVDTVMVRGEIVKRHGRLVGQDIREIRRLAIATRDHLLEQASTDAGINDAALGGHWMPVPLVAEF